MGSAGYNNCLAAVLMICLPLCNGQAQTAAMLMNRVVPNSQWSIDGIVDGTLSLSQEAAMDDVTLDRLANDWLTYWRARPVTLVQIIAGKNAGELHQFRQWRPIDVLPNYYGALITQWPKKPIAKFLMFQGRASTLLQPGGSYASEHVISGDSSPALVVMGGRRFRIVHFRVGRALGLTELIVYLQSETNFTPPEVGMQLVAFFAREARADNVRVIVRPDQWSVDVGFPLFNRFYVHFGYQYLWEPGPPPPEIYYRQNQLECRNYEVRRCRVLTITSEDLSR
jgi:hypothetical protein